MDALATAIVDAASLFRSLLDGTSEPGGNIVANVVAVSQEDMLQSLTSIVQNLAAFVTELLGVIAGKL
jgi:alpha-D-ribose 1-methylphosphonate 5-triphosphate synthase subunit PhnH